MIHLPPKYADRIENDPIACGVHTWADSAHTFYLGLNADQAGAVKLLDAFDRSLQTKRKLVNGFNAQEKTAEEKYAKQAVGEHADRVERRLEKAARGVC